MIYHPLKTNTRVLEEIKYMYIGFF